MATIMKAGRMIRLRFVGTIDGEEIYTLPTKRKKRKKASRRKDPGHGKSPTA